MKKFTGGGEGRGICSPATALATDGVDVPAVPAPYYPCHSSPHRCRAPTVA